jgi:hypothetical protein
MYYKSISIEIKHQEDSLNSLKGPLLARFPELTVRKQEMITKGKQNITFLKELLHPYRSLIAQTQAEERAALEQHGHSHSHAHHQKATNLFYHLAREWGQTPERSHIDRVVAYAEEYWEQIVGVGQEGHNSQRVKILVVGCGMGRVLAEFKKALKGKGQDVLLQGH